MIPVTALCVHIGEGCGGEPEDCPQPYGPGALAQPQLHVYRHCGLPINLAGLHSYIPGVFWNGSINSPRHGRACCIGKEAKGRWPLEREQEEDVVLWCEVNTR